MIEIKFTTWKQLIATVNTQAAEASDRWPETGEFLCLFLLFTLKIWRDLERHGALKILTLSQRYLQLESFPN